MPLILAIEPDRRQASQVTAVVRGRLHAELVLADSAEPALAALGDRVPDLILTSALLSTKDEAAVADRLKQLDGAAAHVQTLTIPVLATPERRSPSGRGVLSALLGDRASGGAAPDGCDPAVFAEQCAAYLGRAAADRKEPVANAPAAAAPAPLAAVAPEPKPTSSAPAKSAPVKPAAAKSAASKTTSVKPAPVPPEVVTPPAVAAAPVAAPPPAKAEAREPDVEIDLSSMLDENVVRQLSRAIETVSRDATSVPERADVRPHDGRPPSPKASTSVPERGDLRPRARRPPSPNKFPDRKPIQDEWGFFDPAQCGFAALLAKLDEITHVASSLPAESHPAGSRSASR